MKIQCAKCGKWIEQDDARTITKKDLAEDYVCENGFAEQKSNDTYDAFMVGEHCCFWFRFILRRGDYNLYLHTYSKEELRKEGIEL